MGYGGLLIPLVATVVAITLLPVILATIGPRLDRRRIRRRDRSAALLAALVGGRRAPPRRWPPCSRWRSSPRCCSPATDLHLGNADPDTIAKEGPAKEGLDALDDSGIGKGAIAPIETLVAEADADEGRRRPGGRSRACTAPRRPAGAGLAQATATALVAARAERGRRVERRAATPSRTCIDAAHAASPSARVGGSGPLNADFIDAVYGVVPADDRADLDRSRSCCWRGRSARCCCR